MKERTKHIEMCRGHVGALARVIALLATIGATSPALAQQPAPTPATQAEQKIDFNIPAQDLNGALLAFADRAGIQLFYDAARVQGLRSPGVKGRLAARDALDRILAGTGLTFHFTGPTSIALEMRSQAAGGDLSVVPLAPVPVESEKEEENAYGPVPGYVAKRSATGTKTDTPLIEVPQSVTVMGREEIEARGAQTVAEALRYAPGLEEAAGQADQIDNIYSRGFKADQYLDGLRLTNSSFGISQIDPYMLERIESIRGPASVLYGQASPGGLIELVSKQPTETPYHEVQIQAGNYSRYQATFDFGGPLDDEGKFLYRLTGLGRDSDTQVKNTKDSRQAIAPSFTWKPNADTKLTLRGSYQHDPDIGTGYDFFPASGTVFSNPNGKISTSTSTGDPSYDKYDRTHYNVGYSFEHHFSDAWTVRQNMRYSHLDGEVGRLFTLATGYVDAAESTIARYAWYDHAKLNEYTVDTQSQFDVDTGPLKHKILVGVDYQNTGLNDYYGGAFAGVPTLDAYDPDYSGNTAPTITPYGHDDQTLSQIGLYAQEQLKFGHLTLVGGLRQDWTSTDTKDLLNGGSTDVDQDALTWRAGAVYNFDFGLAPYVSYATSFQPQIGYFEASGQSIEPTRGKQFEVGVKYQPTGFNGFITAAFFDLYKTNVATSDLDNPGYYVATGEVHSRGVELSGVATLFDNLNLRANYTYTDIENTKTTSATTLGKAPVGVPEHSASIWGDYLFDRGPLDGLGFGLGVRYVGETYGDTANTFKVPDFALVDGMISYDLANVGFGDGWKLSVNGTNLLDKKYVAACSSENSCYYGVRRTVFATLKYDW